MSGSVEAILGNQPVQQANPLQILSGWQDYANKIAQNAQIRAATANTQQATQNAILANQSGQQELAQKMAIRHGQVAYSLSNMSDQQLQGGKPLYDALQQELDSGQIDQQRYNVMKQGVDHVTQSSGGTGAAYRPLINSLLASTMAGPQAAQFLSGSPINVDSGQGLTGGLQGGVGSSAPGALQMNGPTVTTGLLSQAAGAAPTTIQGPNGPIATTVAGLNRAVNPGAAPPNPIGGNGGYVAPGANKPAVPTSGGVAGIAGPQLGAQENVNQNISSYNADQQQVPTRVLNSQNLEKAHDALEMVGTGAGLPQSLATLRSYAQGIATSTGFQLPGINLQDAAAAELDKYLIAYARQSASGAGTNLDQQLSAASNASSHINPTAARNVINTNIGNERMAVAANQSAANPVGYLTHKSQFSSQYDPRGFAVDMYTPAEIKSMVSKMTKPEQAKFSASIEKANQMGLINLGRQNSFKGGVTQNPAPSITQQPLQAPVAPVPPQAVAPPVMQRAPALVDPQNMLSRYGD